MICTIFAMQVGNLCKKMEREEIFDGWHRPKQQEVHFLRQGYTERSVVQYCWGQSLCSTNLKEITAVEIEVESALVPYVQI